MVLNLHSPPVIRQEGDCISEIPVIFGPHAISVIQSFVAPSYVVARYILEVSEHWNLVDIKDFIRNISSSHNFHKLKNFGCIV